MAYDISALASDLEDLIERHLHLRNCMGCIHFDEPSEICTKFQARPPARTIVKGCEHFVEAPPF